ALALSFLAGHSQLSFVILLVVGVYAAVAAVVLPKAERGRPVVAAAVLVAATLGLAAAQLPPTARFVPLSSRHQESYRDAMTFSMPVNHTPLLLFPYLFGDPTPGGPFRAPYAGQWNLTELSGYPGLCAVVLAVAGAGAARRDRRLVALGAAAVLSGALALGPATPLSRLFYRLPVYGQFRSWARYVVVVDLAVAVFAAYGVRRLRRGGAAERRWATVAAAGAAGVVALAAVAVPRLSAVARNLPAGGVRPAAVGLPLAAAVAGAVGALALGRRWRGWPVVVAVLVLHACSVGFFDEWRDGHGPGRTGAEAHNSRQTFWGGVDDRPGGLDRYLFVGADVAPMGADFVNATDYKGLRSANGSGPLAPADYLQALGMSAFGGIVTPDRVWRPNGRALDLLRVTTVLVDRPSARGGPPADSLLQRGTPVPGSTLLRFDHTPALPEAFLVGRAEVRSRPAVLDALWGVHPFDPAAVALLEHPCARCPVGAPAGGGSPGSVRRRAWNANSATFEV